jgi:hypothetical protein
MRQAALLVLVLAGCKIGEHIAAPPVDAANDGGGSGVDASGEPDGPPAVHALRATIGETPQVTGSCDALDTRAEMEDRFDPAVQEQDVVAGWDFDTSADSYDDPTYGFDPNWPSAQSGRFSVRFTGDVTLGAGSHCFRIDIGATGTDIINGKNACGQIYVGTGDAVAETGYSAATSGPATGCVTFAAGEPQQLDIVFWYFNILEQAILHVTVDGSPLDLTSLSAPSP